MLQLSHKSIKIREKRSICNSKIGKLSKYAVHVFLGYPVLYEAFIRDQRFITKDSLEVSIVASMKGETTSLRSDPRMYG